MPPFKKYQGLGNDFILFDLFQHPDINIPEPAQISRICDRRYGVGGDGILLFAPPEQNGTVRMIYFNADGSRAETCFNGLRCIALHAARSRVVLRGDPFTIETDAGDVRSEVDLNDDRVEVELKGAVFTPADVPTTSPSEQFPITLPNGETFEGSALSLGNPHFVVWRESGDLDELNATILRTGNEIEHHPLFPRSVNFELARKVSNNKVIMAVWERGVGRTLACGSGATATVCAGVRRSILPADTPVEVQMAGGTLTVTVDPVQNRVRVNGEAAWVFSGMIDI